MSLLQWDDGFETGIPAADHEHGKLVDWINSIYDRWERRRDPDPSKLFADVVDVFSSHFDFEDRIMREIGYADFEAHAHDHDQALCRLRGILARADEMDYDVTGALALWVQRWLAEHIRLHDAPLYRTLAPGDG
jgi:hemerythrin